jgi:predicted nucleotidyltransferase
MDIFQLLTKNNIKIIKLIDREQLHIRDIADRLHISPGSVHKLIKLMKTNSLISEIKQKNRIVISLNKDNSIVKQIKSVINFNDIINSPAYKKLKRLGKIGIYGSFVDGTNDKESDLDIWLQTEKKEMDLRPVIRELEKQLNVKVNPLILTRSKISSLKKNDPEFYTRLKLTSIGDAFD